jgi:hypothetical protein
METYMTNLKKNTIISPLGNQLGTAEIQIFVGHLHRIGQSMIVDDMLGQCGVNGLA